MSLLLSEEFGSLRDLLHRVDEPSRVRVDDFFDALREVHDSDALRERFDVYISEMIVRHPWLIERAFTSDRMNSLARFFELPSLVIDREFLKNQRDSVRARILKICGVGGGISRCISDVTRGVIMFGLSDEDMKLVVNDLNQSGQKLDIIKAYGCSFSFYRFGDLNCMYDGSLKTFEVSNHHDVLSVNGIFEPDRFGFLHDAKFEKLSFSGVVLSDMDGMHLGEMVDRNKILKGLSLSSGIEDGGMFALSFISRFIGNFDGGLTHLSLSECEFSDDDMRILSESGFLDGLVEVSLRRCSGMSFESVLEVKRRSESVDVSFEAVLGEY